MDFTFRKILFELHIQNYGPILDGWSFGYGQFINLIDNAIKYTNEGTIDINVNLYDWHVKVEIVDT